MFVRELRIENFRNLHPTRFAPAEGVNILWGDNGQGKTNVLESCWLFTGSRSFRGAKDSELVAFGEKEARLELDFTASNREQEATVTVQSRRTATLNGLPLSSPGQLAGKFAGMVFSPEHLALVKDGPEVRRHFADSAYCQLKPGYANSLAMYQKVLVQRNFFLKTRQEHPGRLTEELKLQWEVWDTSLAAAAARLSVARRRYMEKLAPAAREIYAGISGGKETLSLDWQSPVSAIDTAPADVAREWLKILEDARKDDEKSGFTTVGPHREDMILRLGDKPLRTYGSQGQQRSAVLALKLAEATVLQEALGEKPVVFLDDVMSELDVSRQDYILNHIEGWQVFITCCEPSPALRMNAGRVFRVQQGVISNQ